MFVSILQRLGSRVSQHPGEPLQSRADSDTRKFRPGASARVMPKLHSRGDTIES
jgi:hypothetical protein